MSGKYAVIFKTVRELPIPQDYLAMSSRMVELVSQMDGFVKIESITDNEGKGVSISYWDSLDAILKWKENKENLVAQKLGKEKWYKYYKVEVCEILNSYESK
ncbi:MAG: antibiotic biosynthesis monooxygenase [Bdellovibrionaceae bacterium]|nr:antibiotic biosynthesis monooxygenase [Pseudobdellovibrionaceae bacterium]